MTGDYIEKGDHKLSGNVGIVMSDGRSEVVGTKKGTADVERAPKPKPKTT